MDENQELLDLLQQANNALSKSHPQGGYQPVIYTQSPATVYCECGREYHGKMTHVEGMENLYDGYRTKYCPKCILEHEIEWWKQCFRMELD